LAILDAGQSDNFGAYSVLFKLFALLFFFTTISSKKRSLAKKLYSILHKDIFAANPKIAKKFCYKNCVKKSFNCWCKRSKNLPPLKQKLSKDKSLVSADVKVPENCFPAQKKCPVSIFLPAKNNHSSCAKINFNAASFAGD
jgi:hypothetical protein